jgi:anti-sigma-K factor RskA
MTDDDDIDGLAAEYVRSGTLDLAERQRVAARCRTDAALGKAIKAWERCLGSLSDGVPGIEPPDHFKRCLFFARKFWVLTTPPSPRL